MNSVDIEKYVKYTMDLDEVYTEAYYGKGPRKHTEQIHNCDIVLRKLFRLTKWILPENQDGNMHEQPRDIMLSGMYQTIGVTPEREILDDIYKKPFDRVEQYKHWGDILNLYLQQSTKNKSWCHKFNFQSHDPGSYKEWFNQLDKNKKELVLNRALHWAKRL